MEEIFNPFERFYRNKKNDDIFIINEILSEVKKYNVYDFIARVSALRLIPENQSKAVVLDCLIACVLSIRKEELKSNIIMSSGKFRSIISKLNNLDIRFAEDPAENMFVERVMFDDNYYIFQGINYLPSYTLQALISILFKNKNNISNELITKIGFLINTILNISENIAYKLNYNYINVKVIKPYPEIIIPDKVKMYKIKDLLTINKEELETFLGNNEYLNKNIYTSFGQGTIEEALNCNNQKYFESPFLVNHNEVILLDITVLASFAIHHSMIMAKDSGELDDLLDLYNNYIWNDCRKFMEKLGHNKILESSLGIQSNKEKYYKDVLLNVGNDSLMILTGIFDDGRNYNKGELFGSYSNNKLDFYIEERFSHLYEKLYESGIEKKNIFECIIVWSFGRGIELKYTPISEYFPLKLNPYELKCISINERMMNLFLPRYIISKSKLKDILPINFFSELNYIELYDNSDKSFYINDDFNPRKTFLHLEAGESVNYMIKAAQKENRHIVDSYQDGYKTEVILSNDTSKIYNNEIYSSNKVYLYLEFKEIGIWLLSSEFKNEKELNVCFTMVDLVSYWLEQCSKIIDSCYYKVPVLNIELILTGDINKYYYKDKVAKSIEDTIKISIINNSIKIYISSETYQLLECVDNTNEKEFIKCIIKSIKNFMNEIIEYRKDFEKIFNIKFKKKIFSLDYKKYPYFKPFYYDSRIRKIQSADENELLDELGTSLIESNKWEYGIVETKERINITRYVVDYLYNKMKNIIKELDGTNLIELVYYDCEKVLYNLLLESKRYGMDVTCYPEKRQEILSQHNETNRSSVSLKFLIEYLAAVQPDGEKIIGELEYEQLLAICALIIEWAYKGDLFKFNIYNTPIEILKSDRIGMKQEEFVNTNLKMQESRSKMLEYGSLYEFREYSGKGEKFLIDRYYNKLTDAFIDENGFSLEMLSDVVWSIIYIGESQESEIKKYEKKKIIEIINCNLPQYSQEEIDNIINFLSLEKRQNFLEPPSGYRKEDVYPWRFNRELSFTRKPIINKNGELIWGNRCLFHVLGFIIDLIKSGKYKAKKKKLKEIIGKISNERGNQFNDLVYEKIKSYNRFKVYKNIKKVNHKLIADECGNTLGDIDVMFINEVTNTIVLVETKDFSFSKNPYEMYNEYQNMFVDNPNRKSYSTKHYRRAKWIEENIDDILIQFNLKKSKWSIKPVFIVSEYIISNFVYDKGEKIISITELDEVKLLKI